MSAGDAAGCPALFRLSGIRLCYDQERQVLRDLDLSLHAGERLSISGSNGAGKSSLLLVMVGLLVPQAGSIEAFGHPRRGEHAFHEVRRRAGLLFQDPDDQLFCPGVLEDVAFGPLNLGLGRAEAYALASDTLALLGLTDLETRITHRLSGGEKRLVGLAGVLAMKPDVLLLDEPTCGLDDAATRRLTAALDALDQAMVIVTHDAAFCARLATRRLRLDAGRLVAATPPQGGAKQGA